MVLYHSSAYSTNELMPGFKRSGTLVKWDRVENNTWLYATTNRREAIGMGIASLIEKKFLLDRFQFDIKAMTVIITSPNLTNLDELGNLSVFLYSIIVDKHNLDRWQKNNNQYNSMTTEYKTQNTVSANIARKESINIKKFLSMFNVTFISK